ncbi:unnamed protein product [Macrosiphum euphorbiae]|uniref:Uncharacterized protein n=1 Tax=Macrosiphum euphorbiae TaxID=13131 RepID=A0AAV0W7Y5_9HEMI|nr:unnamed protein product [Macrosiphum euphorbiae]
MKTTGKYEHLRKAAAEARQQTFKVDKVDDYGLASVRQVKAISTDEEAERKRNKEKHLSIIQWITEAVDYIKEQLAAHERSKKRCRNEEETTLLWHMSNNQLRTAVYKAAQTRTHLFRTNENLR